LATTLLKGEAQPVMHGDDFVPYLHEHGEEAASMNEEEEMIETDEKVLLRQSIFAVLYS
jgi:hypothetical protein